MSQELRQTSFSGGIFAPPLRSRSDLEKYATALAEAKNVFVTEHGVIKNRAGTVMVSQTKDGKKARLARFTFSNDQSYVLELTDELIRVIAQGQVLATDAASAWASTTRYAVGAMVSYSGQVYRCKATPAVLNPGSDTAQYLYLGLGGMAIPTATAWNVATAYARGATVSLSGSAYVAAAAVTGGGGPGVDTTNWKLIGVIGGQIAVDFDWNPESSYAAGKNVRYYFNPWWPWGAIAQTLASVTASGASPPNVDTAAWEHIAASGDPVTITVPWAEADIFRVKFAQSGDVVSTAHRSYEPGEIRRKSHVAWEYGYAHDRRPASYREWSSAVTFAKGDIVRAWDGSDLAYYAFYQSLADSNTNHVPSASPTWWKPVAGLDAHLPPADLLSLARERSFVATGSYMAYRVTVIEQLDQTGDDVHPVKEWAWVVTALYGDGVESVPSPILMPAAWANLAQTRKCVLYPDKPVTFTWTACPGAVAYRIYRGRSGIFGFVGEAEASKVNEGLGGGLFQDDGVTPDWSRQPPTGAWPFGLRTWEARQVYRPDEVVLAPNGYVYRCAVGGLSGLTPPTGVSGLMADGAVNAWRNATAYVAGDVVVNQDATYICEVNHTSSNVDGQGRPYPGPWGAGCYASVFMHGWKEPQIAAGTRAWTYLGPGGAVQWMFVSSLAEYSVRQPDAVLYHEGRRFYASLGRLFGSCVDDYANFDASDPARDDEAVSLTLASREFEEIRSLASMDGGLMALSVTGEWMVRGAGQDEPISPNSALTRRGSGRGSSWLDPVTVGDALLYVQPRGGRVRELAWDGNSGRYGGADLSIFSRHLFEGREVVAWDYQETPDSIVWAALDDGSLLSLTYHREHQMAAWTRHAISGGLVESVCVIPENGEDRVYLVVNRAGTRYIERLASRNIDPDDPSTWNFVDGAVAYPADEEATRYTSFGGLGHLAGQSVVLVSGTNVLGPFVVPGNGILNLAAQYPEGFFSAVIGVPYDVELETLPFPQGRGNQKMVAKVTAEVESLPVAFQAGETLDSLTTVTPSGTGLAERDVQIRPKGHWNPTGSVALKISSPTPITLHAIRREVEGGGR